MVLTNSQDRATFQFQHVKTGIFKGDTTIMTTGGMPMSKREVRELTDAEREAFMADNRYAAVAFAGDEPYVIVVSYRYAKGTLRFAVRRTNGRKWGYINKNPNVCVYIWQFGEQSNVPSLKEQQYSSVILDGKLEEIAEADWSYYELPPPPKGVDLVAFKLKVDTVGTRSTKYIQ